MQIKKGAANRKADANKEVATYMETRDTSGHIKSETCERGMQRRGNSEGYLKCGGGGWGSLKRFFIKQLKEKVCIGGMRTCITRESYHQYL